jgi:carbamoyl-phosphate synthase large subunit
LLIEQPDSTLTAFEEVLALLREAKEFPELMVMEYLPGDEYSVDIVADGGQALVVVPRIREKIILGASFIGTVVKHEHIMDYSRKITRGLRLNGAIGIQFKLDKEGIPKIIEVNARPHGALMLSAAAGANILYLAVKVALGEKFAQPNIRWNTRMLRYYDEVYQDEEGRFFKI